MQSINQFLLINIKNFAVYDNTRVLHAASIMIQKKGRILVFDREAQAVDNNNNNSSEQHTKDYNDTASHSRRQLPQHDKDEKLVGIITASDIVRAFSQTTANPSLESIMTRRVFPIDCDSRISSAIDIMFKKRIGSIIVNKGGRPYGIFTEKRSFDKSTFRRSQIRS